MTEVFGDDTWGIVVVKGIFLTKWQFVLLTIVADDVLWLAGLNMWAVVLNASDAVACVLRPNNA